MLDGPVQSLVGPLIRLGGKKELRDQLPPEIKSELLRHLFASLALYVNWRKESMVVSLENVTDDGDISTVGVRGGFVYEGLAPVYVQRGMNGKRWHFIMPVPTDEPAYFVHLKLQEAIAGINKVRKDWFLPEGESVPRKGPSGRGISFTFEPGSCPIEGRVWKREVLSVSTVALAVAYALGAFRTNVRQRDIVAAVKQINPNIVAPYSCFSTLFGQKCLQKISERPDSYVRLTRRGLAACMRVTTVKPPILE